MSDFLNAGWANDAFMKPSVGKLAVCFKKVQRKNEFKSKEQNRPVFEEKIHIVKVPADQTLRIDRPMRETDKDEFPAEWAQFEKTGESRMLGIPIENWHTINETQKAEFKAMGLHTIEQIANLSDQYCQGKMGLADLRKKALVFLETGKDAELVAKIKAEAAAEVNALKEKMAKMEAMLEQMTQPAGKK